jgi:predicted transcriptional regulator
MIDLSEKVTVKELRGILQLTQKQLAELAHVDVGVVKRAESPTKSVQYLTGVRLVNALDNELHKRQLLDVDTKLLITKVAIRTN